MQNGVNESDHGGIIFAQWLLQVRRSYPLRQALRDSSHNEGFLLAPIHQSNHQGKISSQTPPFVAE